MSLQLREFASLKLSQNRLGEASGALSLNTTNVGAMDLSEMCVELTCTYRKLTSNASSFKICSLSFDTDDMKAFYADDTKKWLQQGTHY